MTAKLTGATVALLTALCTTFRGADLVADTATLAKYAGTYQWQSAAGEKAAAGSGSYIYLQLWPEFTGQKELVSFDESGVIRTLYPDGEWSFVAGPGAAVPGKVDAHVRFSHDDTGRIDAMTWTREGGDTRVARAITIERREDVRFTNVGISFAGTLLSPATPGRHPAIVLVHGSGDEDREYMLPFAHFLVRHGIAILGFDKRGSGKSGGNWKEASFDDLAGDIVAAVNLLKARPDIDRTQIGLFGGSQAGWIMPLAAARVPDLGFMVVFSGPGVSAAETTLDQARNEMAGGGMPPEGVDRILSLMRLQYEYARTGKGWEEYMAARSAMVARLGAAPEDTFPGARNNSHWDFMRRIYFYDPAPAITKLRVPILALFGELDNNVMASKNRAAWEGALKSGQNKDYTLTVLHNADHIMLSAIKGTNAEMRSLNGFVPEYQTTVLQWLRRHARGLK